MIPGRRLFVLFGLTTVVAVAGVLTPGLLPLALVLDLGLVCAALLDAARARRLPLTAARTWPAALVQGTAAEVEVELRSRGGQRCGELVLYEALHPALAEQPLRLRLRSAEVERDLWGAGYSWRYRVTPWRRGSHPVGPLVARVLGPWRLAYGQRVLLPAESVRVLPRVRWGGRVGQLLNLARRHQLGSVALQRPGDGGEPYSLRPYRSGDPRNRIHWKASARRGELITREHVWERGAPLHLLIDCGRAMATQAGRLSKLDYAVAASLALCRVASSRGDRVTVIAFSDRIERRVGVHPGPAGIAAAYAELYDLETRLVEPLYDLAAETVLSHSTQRTTVVLLTSVVDLAVAELLRAALLDLTRRHRPLLVNLEDPEIERLALLAPGNAAEAYAKLSCLDILLGNRDLARRLRHGGVRAVSASADRLALETLEGYLALLQPAGLDQRRLSPRGSRARGRRSAARVS